MEQNGFGKLRTGLREAVATLTSAHYWTERRDACEQLFKTARQIVYQLRIAAEDKDPDIQHWGQHACEQLKKDLEANPASLKALIGDIQNEIQDKKSPVSGETAESAEPIGCEEIQPISVEELLHWLRDFAQQMHGTFQERAKGASIVLPVNGQRKQTVLIDLNHNDTSGRTMVLFYSICGEAKPETYRWALEANCGMNRGAFGVIKSQDKDVLILLMRRPLDELILERLGNKLRTLASKADDAESRLKTQDTF